MTDKQIIIYKKECYNEPHCSLNQVLEQLEAKEQECEELRKKLIKCDNNIIVDCGYSKKDLCSFIHRKKEVINGLQEQLDQLKEQLEAYKMEAEEGIEINAELKAENDGLKRQHQGDKGLITSTGKMNYQLIQEYDKLKTENKRLKETFDSLFKVQYKLADNNKKLRQCLTEIKEIAENREIFCENCGGGVESFTCDDCGYVKILQKISECEVMDE